jgi:conjugal transfer ATP-binding protein TraC
VHITELHNRLLDRKNPAELLSVLAFDDATGLYFHADGCLGYMILGDPLTGVDDRVVQQLQPLLGQNFPPNSVLQVTLWSSPDVEDQLLRMREIRVPTGKGPVSAGRRLATALVEGRAQYLREHTFTPISALLPVRVRNIQAVVSVKVPCGAGAPNEGDIEKVGRLRQTTEQILRTLGMAPMVLDPERYLRIVGSIVNSAPNASWRRHAALYDSSRLIREQVFDLETTLRTDSRGLRLGDRRVRTLCAKRRPEYVHLMQAAQFLGDLRTGSRGVRENVLITLNVLFPEAEQARAAMTAKKNATTWQSTGGFARYLPRLARQKEDFDALFAALEDGDRVVRAYPSFCLFADSEEEAIAATSNMLTYYRELGYTLQEDRFVALPIFLNALPGNAETDPAVVKNLQRYRTMAGRHAAHMLPIIADWKGTGTPLMTLLSRNGQLMSVDLFDSQTNYSGLVAAESGSGKSFFVNFLVTSYLSVGADVFLIEVGRSFANLCQVLGGEHLEFSADSDLSLNPFSVIESYEEQSDFLLAVLVAMVSPKGAITEYQESTLRRVVRELWDLHGKELSVDLLAATLIAYRDASGNPDARVSDLGVQLYPFTTKGEYGRWFSRASTVQFNNSFVVLELEELKARRHLMGVVLVQLMAVIQQAMFLRRDGRPKLLIIDEGYDVICQGAEGKFVERGFRQLRKARGGVVLILQGVNDLYKSEVGEAIWENTGTKFLLSQTPEAIEGLIQSKRLALSEGAAEVLKTVRTERGVYSEIFIYRGTSGGIARFMVDRRTELLYSTDPTDKAAIAARIQAGMTLEEAIEDIVGADRRPRALAS